MSRNSRLQPMQRVHGTPSDVQVLMNLAAVLVEDKINNEILKDGIALPPMPHVQPQHPSIALQEHVLSVGTDFLYVP